MGTPTPAPTYAERMHDVAREQVRNRARKALADSPLFGREYALAYAIGWLEPLDAEPDDVNVARARGVFAGLRDAGLITP